MWYAFFTDLEKKNSLCRNWVLFVLRALDINFEFWWLSHRKNDIAPNCRLHFHLCEEQWCSCLDQIQGSCDLWSKLLVMSVQKICKMHRFLQDKNCAHGQYWVLNNKNHRPYTSLYAEIWVFFAEPAYICLTKRM